MENTLMKKKGLIIGIIVMAAGLLLTGCPPRKTIAEVNRDPSRYKEREVTVVGRVTKSYGAMQYGIYEIDDGTGKMWVACQQGQGVPRKDAFIAITGKVRADVTISDKFYATVFQETRERK